jgi:hypothetical protein
MNIRLALIRIANALDLKGFYREADVLDGIIPSIEHTRVTPDDILKMPNAEQIVNEARNWVHDCNWSDEEHISSYTPTEILKGVDRHYEGGLSQFLANTNMF